MALFKIKTLKKTVQEENPTQTAQFKGLSIGKILWAGFLVIAIITLISGYSSYLLYAERIDDNREAQQLAIAERAATIFTVRINALSEQIERILSVESVQHALATLPVREVTPPEVLQERLKEQLPELIRQLIIDANTHPNDQVQPPLSYACLELSSQQSPIMELHRFGTEDQHLDIAFPIRDNRSLLLSFNPRLVQQWLKTIDSSDGYIVLQQQIDSHAPLAFGQTGDVHLAGNRNSIIHPIPGTKFQIAVTLPIVQPLAQVERVLFFVNFGVTLVLIALILWATLITVRLVLKKDLVTIGSLIKRSSFSLHHILPIKLAELRGCAEAIKQELGIDEIETEDDKPDALIKNETASQSQAETTADVSPDTDTEIESKEESK